MTGLACTAPVEQPPQGHCRVETPTGSRIKRQMCTRLPGTGGQGQLETINSSTARRPAPDRPN